MQIFVQTGLLFIVKIFIFKIIYFDSFEVEHVPKVIEKYIGHRVIKTNIFRIQSNIQ